VLQCVTMIRGRVVDECVRQCPEPKACEDGEKMCER
jgi:hypothetical protein